MRPPGLGRAVGAAAAAVLLLTANAGAQSRAVRFDVDSVADSTFVFAIGRERWVKPSRSGIVVDPARRDALVARFRVLGTRDGRAVGLVTGQTTDLMRSHVALLEPPNAPWYRSGTFWGGLVLGLAAGAAAGTTF